MADPIRTFVVLDAGVKPGGGRAGAAARSTRSRSSGSSRASTRPGSRLHETSNDLLLVACSGQSEPALNLIDRRRQPSARAGRSSCSRTARRTASRGASSQPAPTTWSCCPPTPDEVLFALQKVIARKAGRAEAGSFSPRAAHLRARPEGRHRQDADLDLASRSRSPSAARRSCSSTSTCSSATSGSALGLDARADDLRPRPHRRRRSTRRSSTAS